MRKSLVFFLVMLALGAHEVSASVTTPQYIFVRKDNTCSNCYNWNGYDPSAINLDAVNEIFGRIGTKGTATRRLGIGVVFFYNQIPLSNLKSSLQRLLDYSLIHDFPVFIALDGFEWWDNRPDLWNWWDPSAPGYNPDNRHNVEWTCWEPSCATDKAWRNWGSELVVKPQPNIASPTFIAANQYSLSQLVPLISSWYQSLPEDKKYLLGGVSTSVEQDIGANYYYYAGGLATGQGLLGSVQQGYAAVKTSGIKSSGSITPDDLDTVISQYQTTLNQTVFDLGIPKNKLWNHNAAAELLPIVSHPPGVSFPTMRASLNPYAQPGWSLYGDVTAHPQNYASLTQTLDQLNNAPWASPEWLTWATDYNGWVESLRATLSYRHNHFLNVANWESIRDKPYALEAIRTVLHESPPNMSPGDLNQDGHVNIFDYNLLVAGFGTEYTIFDYNTLVTNYGK